MISIPLTIYFSIWHLQHKDKTYQEMDNWNVNDMLLISFCLCHWNPLQMWKCYYKVVMNLKISLSITASLEYFVIKFWYDIDQINTKLSICCNHTNAVPGISLALGWWCSETLTYVLDMEVHTCHTCKCCVVWI